MSDRMAAQGEWNPWRNGNQGGQSPEIETTYPWDSSNSEETTIPQSYSTSTADTVDGGWTATNMEIRPTTLDTATATATFGRGFTITSSITDTYAEPTTITSLSSGSPASSSTHSSTTSSATTTSSISTLTTSAVVSSRIEDSKPANNTTRTVAIAVPVSVVGAALLFGALFFFLRRRRRRHTRQDIASTSHIDVSQSTRATLLPLNASSWEIGPPRSPTPLEIPFPSPQASTDRLSTTQPYPPAPPQTQPTSTPTTQSFPLPASPSPAARAFPQEHAQLHEHASAPLRESSTSTSSPREVSPASARPTSPFDHPLDDAMSEISRLSDRRERVHRNLDDDVSSVSSVSSIGDDDVGGNANRSRTRFQ